MPDRPPPAPRTPVPPLLLARAEALLTELARRCAPAEARLASLLGSGRRVRNRVAVTRWFTRIERALGAEGRCAVVAGRNHWALLADMLRAGWLSAASPAQELGVGFRRTLVLAGRHGQADMSAISAEFGLHALARFMERSGLDDGPAVSAAIAEACRHADQLLRILVSPRLLPRLVGRGTPILLPAGAGAFLGMFRVTSMSGKRRIPMPLIEAATWLHGFVLPEPAARLRAALLEGRTGDELAPLLLALPEPAAGDRRAASGFEFWRLGDPPDVQDELLLLATPALVAARLAAGEAGPDELVREICGCAPLW